MGIQNNRRFISSAKSQSLSQGHGIIDPAYFCKIAWAGNELILAEPGTSIRPAVSRAFPGEEKEEQDKSESPSNVEESIEKN